MISKPPLALAEALNGPQTFTELNRTLQAIESEVSFDKKVTIGLSSNVTAEPATYYFKKHAFLHNVGCQVYLGDYNSHIQNIQSFMDKNVDQIIIHNLFDNLSASFESKILMLNETELAMELDRFEKELSACLNLATDCRSVLVDKLYLAFSGSATGHGQERNHVVQLFNNTLLEVVKKYPNSRTIDSQSIVQKLGSEKAFDLRYYYKFKAPFTYSFWDAFCADCILISQMGTGVFYKVLVLDCDNTLWGGILGEDLLDGIQLNPHDYPGNIFWRVQNQILSLQKKGVLLCLASKNNPSDVDEVLNTHSSQVIKDQHIVLKKVNWESKASNIQQLSTELNLGLDSFIFIDDSEFEIQAINNLLPQVRTFKVPNTLQDYPALLSKVEELFFSTEVSSDNAKKTEEYRQRALALQEQGKHVNFEDYLKSLEIKVEIKLNFNEKAQRIAELTQKSNQFNLTTKRYTSADISNFILDPTIDVFSIHVADRFGDAGLTGVMIFRRATNEVLVDSFLMSCRVIGRKIEFSIWSKIFDYYSKHGLQVMKTEYLKTSKNSQVEFFYDTLGFPAIETSDKKRVYQATLEEMKTKLNHEPIEVLCEF